MYCGFLSTGNRLDAQVSRVRRFEKNYKDQIEFVYPSKTVHRIFHDFARNKVVEEFLETDCDVLWFLDSDILPHENTLELITKHWDKWQAAGCPYPVFMTPSNEDGKRVVYTVYKSIAKDSKNGIAAAHIPAEGTDFVDGIATGCLFIKRAIFENLEKPYFKFVYRESDRHIEMGEDIDFCLRVNKLGHQFFIDYSMVCSHFKHVDLLEVNDYAIDFANKTLKNYDAMIRSEMAKKFLRR